MEAWLRYLNAEIRTALLQDHERAIKFARHKARAYALYGIKSPYL